MSDASSAAWVYILTEEYQSSGVDKATCPAGQLVEPRTSFVCTVEIGRELNSRDRR